MRPRSSPRKVSTTPFLDSCSCSTRFDDFLKSCLTQGPHRTRCQVKLYLINGESVLALRDAVYGEPEITRLRRHAVRQLAAHGETGRRADNDQGIAASIQ